MMSSALTETASLPAAPRAGADLRAARERLGWPIEDVAGALRIRQPHLEALEDGRIDLLPGNAYAVGFLRTYAKALGLDPDEIVRRFKAEASEVNRRTELVFPAPMPQRGLPAGAVILLGVVLAISAYAGWYRLSGEGRLPAETVAPVPQRLAPLAEQALPPTVRTAARPASAAPGEGAATLQAGGAAGHPGGGGTGVAGAAPSGSVASSRTAAGQGSSAGFQPSAGNAATLPAAAGGAGSTGAPATAALAAVRPPASAVPAISPTSAAAASLPLAMAAPAAPAPAAASTGPASGAGQIVLKATADAWVQVRERNGGTVLLNRILHSGDSWLVPSQPNLVLTTGNAGGTELVVDGETMQVPGGSGAVRRDLPLDAELIKQDGLAQLTPIIPPGGAVPAARPTQPSTGQPGADQPNTGQPGAGRPGAGQPSGSRPATQ